MQGLYYLLTLIAFVIVVLWLMQNDPLPAGKRTVGLLRMTEAKSLEATEATDKLVGPAR